MADTSRRSQRTLAAILVTGFLVLRVSGNEFGEINPEPTDQTAVAGELAFFQCQYSMGSLLPTWLINGVEHIPSNLPAGHWINSSGLVVSAEVGRNGTSYQCQFNVFISSLNAFITRTSNMPAYLTVTIPDGNTIIASNFLIGPTITGYNYNSSSSSFTLSWDRLHPRISGMFRISFRNCSQSVSYIEPAIIGSLCNATEIVGLDINDTLLIEVQSCNTSSGECGFNLDSLSPPNLVVINFTNKDSSIGEPVLLETSQSYNLMLDTTCQGQLIIRSISSMGTRKDTAIDNTAFLTRNTVSGRQVVRLHTDYINEIRGEFGSNTEWVIVQEVCIAVLCDGREIADMFGMRGLVSISSSSSEANLMRVAPNCTYHVPQPPSSSTQEVMVTSMVIGLDTTTNYAGANPTTRYLPSEIDDTPSPTLQPQTPMNFDQILAVSAVGSVLVALILILSLLLIIVGVLVRKRKSARTYGISGTDKDREETHASMAYLATPEKSSTLRSTPSFMDGNGVRTISALVADDDDDLWVTRLGAGDFV